jgi:hypothetical protein
VTPPVTARALCDVPSAPDTPTDADIVARIPKANPDLALDTHVRLELGVNPDDAGSSRQAAVVPFLSFSAGAHPPTFALVLHPRFGRLSSPPS